MKFGGTSVGSVERIRAVADRVVRAREAGNDVIVVVSRDGPHHRRAAGDGGARSPTVPDPRELDMLLTAGERIAMSLLGIALNARGCRAASYTGSQAGIITDTQHGEAKIIEIRPKRILEALEAGNVVILAGFQGLSSAVRDHDARAAAAPTSRRSRWPARSAPRSARSTPTSTACSPPTRGSCRTRARST